MPMTLTVGLARKIGEANFGSRGASIEIEMELESSLVSEPAKLRERIRQLFDSVRTSLTEELNGRQRWSRHRTGENPWRPGVDDLSTHLILVDDWFAREFIKRAA